MQTIADRAESNGILAASFFFARTVENRNGAKRFIPTIAYQLALSIPAVKPFIEEAIESDLSIFDRSLPRQMHALIVQPLREAYRSSGLTSESGIWLMLIDGLDECAGEDSQVSIVQEFSSILLFEKHPFRLIIASRPEWHLQALFSLEGLRNVSWQHVLDEANADIKEFLQFRFSKMKETHPLGALIPDSWPSPDVIQTLVNKSSGQFIYAATVVSYVSARQRNPIQSLDVILGIKSPTIGDNPFAELDSLYRHILLTADKPALQMLTFLVLPVQGTEKLGMTMRSLALLLSLQHGEIYISLLKFSSLLNVPPLEDSGKDIRVCHASLGDFLMDRSRAGPDLFVEQGKVHAEIASRWLQQSFNPLGSPVTEAQGFANHLSCASVTDELTKELSEFNLVMWITIHINHFNDIASSSTSDVQNIIVRESLAQILMSIQVRYCIICMTPDIDCLQLFCHCIIDVLTGSSEVGS